MTEAVPFSSLRHFITSAALIFGLYGILGFVNNEICFFHCTRMAPLPDACSFFVAEAKWAFFCWWIRRCSLLIMAFAELTTTGTLAISVVSVGSCSTLAAGAQFLFLFRFVPARLSPFGSSASAVVAASCSFGGMHLFSNLVRSGPCKRSSCLFTLCSRITRGQSFNSGAPQSLTVSCS